MAALTVVIFSTADGAEQMLRTLQDLQQQQAIKIQGAAGIVWPSGAKKPEAKQLPQLNITDRGALGGAFWGLLFEQIFFVPLLELTDDGCLGSLSHQFAAYGLDDDFIQLIRDKVTEGTSALFLLAGHDTLDRIVDAGARLTFEIIAANLSRVEEDRLREAFAAHDEPSAHT